MVAGANMSIFTMHRLISWPALDHDLRCGRVYLCQAGVYAETELEDNNGFLASGSYIFCVVR